MRARAGIVAAAAAGILLALAACTPAAPDAEPRTWGASYPMNAPTDPDVLRYCPNEIADHFDGDPGAINAVYSCTVEPTEQTVDRIASHGVDALLTAYSAPDAAPTDEACPAMMADPLVVWIADGDDIVAVRAPVGGCGFPTDEAKKAFQDAPRETILVARETDSDG